MPLQILAYFSFLDWSLLAKELLFSADISISPPVEEATRSTEQNKSPFLFRAKNKKGKEKERIPFPGVTEKMNVLPEQKKALLGISAFSDEHFLISSHSVYRQKSFIYGIFTIYNYDDLNKNTPRIQQRDS